MVDDRVSVAIGGGLSFIEQLHAAAIGDACPHPSRPYLIGTKSEHKAAIIIRPACKLWSCPVCSLRNSRRWIARIINGINEIGGDWHMFTLTAHRKMRGSSSVKSLREGWKKWYNRLRRELKKTDDWPIHYIRVWEQHEDGSFHLHGLVNYPVDPRWMKDNAVECGMGYQTDIHHVENAGMVAGYISKYTLKNASVSRGGVPWPKNHRRIEVSRGFPKLPDLRDDEYQWEVIQNEAYVYRRGQQLADMGYKIYDATESLEE